MARRRARPPARTSGEGEAKGEVFTGETLLEAIEEGSFDRPGVDLVGSREVVCTADDWWTAWQRFFF